MKNSMYKKISWRSRVIQLAICVGYVIVATLISGELMPKLMLAGIGCIFGVAESAILRRTAKKEDTGYDVQIATFGVLMLFSIIYAAFTNSSNVASMAVGATIFCWTGKIKNV